MIVYKRLAKMFIKSNQDRSLRVTTWTLPVPFTRWGIAIVRNGWNSQAINEEYE